MLSAVMMVRQTMRQSTIARIERCLSPWRRPVTTDVVAISVMPRTMTTCESELSAICTPVPHVVDM